MAIRVEALTQLSEIEVISAQWVRLVERSQCNRACASPVWCIAGFEAFPNSAPYVIAAWSDAELLGVFPLSTSSASSQAVAVNVFSDYNDIVCESAHDTAAVACLNFALMPPKPYVALNLCRVPRSSNCTRAIELLRHELGLYFHPEGRHCYIRVAATFEEFIGTKSKNFRSSLRRAEEAARQGGAVVREIQPEHISAEDLIDVFLRLHYARFGDASAFRRAAANEAFVRAVLPRLFAERRIRVFAVEHAGRIEAIDIALAGHAGLCTWNGGYSSRAACWSPGWLLTAAEIRASHELGLAEYDLMRGTQPWKTRWANATREVGRLTIPVGAFSTPTFCASRVAVA